MKLTSTRRSILKYLSSSNPDNCAYPPYSARQIADDLEMPISNTLRTLNDLVGAGLVVKEDNSIWVVGYENGLGAIKGRWDYQRDGYVYWNASTFEQDKLPKINRTDNAWKAFDRFLTDHYDNENNEQMPVLQ